MSRLANVLVASADTARQGVLVDILAENQCSALGCDTADELMSLARSTHPDLILIDMADPSMDGLAVARNLRAEGRRPDSPMPAAPIMVIASQRRADLYEDALAMGVEDVLVDPLDDAELMCRIWPLLRLSTIATEVEGRIRAATALGAAVPPDGDDGSDLPGSVLVLRDTAVTQESQVPLPYGGGFTFVSAVSNRDAERLLSKQAFDAVVLVAVDGDGAERMLAFCELLRSKPNLYDLPVILIAPKAAITDRSDPYWRGVTRLVLAPAPHQEIEYGLSGLTARKRRRWSLRRALDRIRVPDLCDPVTKLYGEPFLRANLGILVEDARTWHRRLSLIHLRMNAYDAIAGMHGRRAADLLARQTAQWIQRSVRAEDLLARAGQDSFCICLPGIPLNEAALVRDRITGLLSRTAFALGSPGAATAMRPSAGLAWFESGDTPDTLLRRARQGHGEEAA